MKTFNDRNLISEENLIKIIDSSFSESTDKICDEKGTGSFCKFVKYDDKYYAVLSTRAEKITFNVIYNVMNIINQRHVAVPILGGQISEKGEADSFSIVMPKVEGLNLPSYVYTQGKNIDLIKNTANFTQEAYNALAKECIDLNENTIRIDFHGGNFIYEPSTQMIRMIDLKQRRQYDVMHIVSKFIQLSTYDKMRMFNDPEKRRRIADSENGIDIDMMTAKNVIKSCIALSKAGIKDRDLNAAIVKIYDGEKNLDSFK